MNPELLKALIDRGWRIHATDGQTYIQFVAKAGATLTWEEARGLCELAGHVVYDPKIPRPTYLHVYI